MVSLAPSLRGQLIHPVAADSDLPLLVLFLLSENHYDICEHEARRESFQSASVLGSPCIVYIGLMLSLEAFIYIFMVFCDKKRGERKKKMLRI